MPVRSTVTLFIKHRDNFIQRPLSFEMWGMDIIGAINPPTSKGHHFILAITDYFSKWAEVVPLKEIKTSDVIKFIKHHVLYRFGVSRWIVHNNGPNSSAKHSKDSVIDSESKVRHQRHTIQLPTVLQKPLKKLLEKFSRNLFKKVNVTGMTN